MHFEMNWKGYIVSDKDILDGKPIIKGTRLSVEFILERLADGWSEDEVLQNYPGLSKESLKAVNCSLYISMVRLGLKI